MLGLGLGLGNDGLGLGLGLGDDAGGIGAGGFAGGRGLRLRLAGPVVGSRGAGFGVGDQLGGLVGGSGVGIGGLAGEALLLDGEDAPGLGDLTVGGGAGLLHLTLRTLTQRGGLLLGGELDLGGLALGLRARVFGVRARLRLGRGGLVGQGLPLRLDVGEGVGPQSSSTSCVAAARVAVASSSA